MYFMSTVCGRPQGGEGGSAHVDACGQGEGDQKRDFFVDVINGWPLISALFCAVWRRIVDLFCCCRLYYFVPFFDGVCLTVFYCILRCCMSLYRRHIVLMWYFVLIALFGID